MSRSTIFWILRYTFRKEKPQFQSITNLLFSLIGKLNKIFQQNIHIRFILVKLVPHSIRFLEFWILDVEIRKIVQLIQKINVFKIFNLFIYRHIWGGILFQELNEIIFIKLPISTKSLHKLMFQTINFSRFLLVEVKTTRILLSLFPNHIVSIGIK